MKIALALAFAVGLFFCLSLAMGIGMAVGEFAGNVLLTGVLVVAAIVGGAVLWRSREKSEP